MPTNPLGSEYTSYSNMVWELLQYLPEWMAPVQSTQDNTHALLALQAIHLDRARDALNSLVYNALPGTADINQAWRAWTYTDRLIGGLEVLAAEVYDYSSISYVGISNQYDVLDFLTLPERMVTADGDHLYFRNLCLVQEDFPGPVEATLSTFYLSNVVTGLGSATLLDGEPVYWSEDDWSTYYTIDGNTSLVNINVGQVELTTITDGATISLRYSSRDVYTETSKLPAVRVNNTSVDVARYDLWTTFDSAGLMLGCERIPEEPNYQYRDRLLTVFRAPGNITSEGSPMGIARNLGLLQQTVWTVSSLTSILNVVTNGNVYVVDPTLGPVHDVITIQEELQPGYANQYWYPSRTPIRGGVEEIYVDQRRTSITLQTINGQAAASLGTQNLVTARYDTRLWTDTGTRLVSYGLEYRDYVVYYASAVTLSQIDNSAYQETYLLDARGRPNERFFWLVNEINRRSPVTWGAAQWKRGIYFFDDNEPQPQTGYMPGQWDSHLTY